MTKEKTAYHIGNISIDVDGVYWINWWGRNTDGKMGQLVRGSTDIGALLKSVTKNMHRNKQEILEKVKELDGKSEQESGVNEE
jgi:hypothetical protein